MCDKDCASSSDSHKANHPGRPEKPLTLNPHLGVRENNTNKRKLPVPTLSIPETCSADGLRLGALTCKSPKIVSPGNSRVWSSPTCTICMDDLFSFVNSERKPDLWNSNNNLSIEKNIRPILSTRCGHLFHTECINKWFQENKEKEEKECPFCKREMMANDTTRIFPIFEID